MLNNNTTMGSSIINDLLTNMIATNEQIPGPLVNLSTNWNSAVNVMNFKDVNPIKKLVDDCVGSQLSVSLRPHDTVSVLGPMYHAHERSHLLKMEASSRALFKLSIFCQAKKHEKTMCVHTSMQKVSSLQSGIRDIRFQLSAFNEAMIRQDEIFAELKLVRRIGPAYKTCLAEVVRRKALMKLYMGQAGQVAEKMARMRETKVIKQEQHLKHMLAYISRDVLAAMGTFNNPNQWVFNIVPFYTNLNIDADDLECLRLDSRSLNRATA